MYLITLKEYIDFQFGVRVEINTMPDDPKATPQPDDNPSAPEDFVLDDGTTVTPVPYTLPDGKVIYHDNGAWERRELEKVILCFCDCFNLRRSDLPENVYTAHRRISAQHYQGFKDALLWEGVLWSGSADEPILDRQHDITDWGLLWFGPTIWNFFSPNRKSNYDFVPSIEGDRPYALSRQEELEKFNFVQQVDITNFVFFSLTNFDVTCSRDLLFTECCFVKPLELSIQQGSDQGANNIVSLSSNHWVEDVRLHGIGGGATLKIPHNKFWNSVTFFDVELSGALDLGSNAFYKRLIVEDCTFYGGIPYFPEISEGRSPEFRYMDLKDPTSIFESDSNENDKPKVFNHLRKFWQILRDKDENKDESRYLPKNIRVLKRYASQSHDYHFALDLNRLELLAKIDTEEKGFLRKSLIRAYEMFGRCGTSALRPAVWWGVLSALMALFLFSVHDLSVGHAVKVAIENGLVFGQSGDGLRYGGLLMLTHKIASIPLLFLFGLGLRNYFKLR